eukprot:Gb_05018 [translate_table: standard]
MIPAGTEDQEKKESITSYILGARSVPNEQVRIAPTEIDGIGPKEATQVRYRLGENEQTSNDQFLFLVIVEFVIKMDRPYAVNELILMLGLVANSEEFRSINGAKKKNDSLRSIIRKYEGKRSANGGKRE